MMLKSLLAEFEHEVASTRKLLLAVPQKDIDYRPAPTSWTMGELAQHIATIYYWYVGTLTEDVYDMAADRIQRGDPGDIQATVDLFEKNVESARAALHSISDEKLQDLWTMKSGDHTLIGPMPRGVVVRSFLFNHVYHHRGEMIVYLRATGNKVPGLYGPTYDDRPTR
ncbi:MAG TPA: DinB family protein [Parapedobacter sp.]|uniref:DinB family protein n=1 Tax=Parapedobacter sp. TaxID=1958893 RepID=UPI002B91D9B7|nr:DinB family protein [Parapedobacter sp.]HWK56197.1 DinB family protein [Parapedobacter sp.]